MATSLHFAKNFFVALLIYELYFWRGNLLCKSPSSKFSSQHSNNILPKTHIFNTASYLPPTNTKYTSPSSTYQILQPCLYNHTTLPSLHPPTMCIALGIRSLTKKKNQRTMPENHTPASSPTVKDLQVQVPAREFLTKLRRLRKWVRVTMEDTMRRVNVAAESGDHWG